MAGGPDGWRGINLQGNHEQITMIACAQPEPRIVKWWIKNGGGTDAIGTKRTKIDVCFSAVSGSKADMADLMRTRPIPRVAGLRGASLSPLSRCSCEPIRCGLLRLETA